jgi:hypothetical protein
MLAAAKTIAENIGAFLLFAQLDVGILDDLRPFGDVDVDDGSEFVW